MPTRTQMALEGIMVGGWGGVWKKPVSEGHILYYSIRSHSPNDIIINVEKRLVVAGD